MANILFLFIYLSYSWNNSGTIFDGFGTTINEDVA
jgi:hypothetical protein